MALLVLMVVLYLLDRRFIGILPNIFRPIQLSQRLRRTRQQLALSPFNASLKLQAARILLEKRRYSEAMVLLDELIPVMNDSADVWFEAGRCRLKLGDLRVGEAHMIQALQLNARVRYGEPYLRLGEAFATEDQSKSLSYLRQFQEIHSSSCEAYYRLGLVLESIDQKEQAQQAYEEALAIYRSLPKYKRKSERRWVWLARRKKLI